MGNNKFLEEWYDGAKVENVTRKPQPGSLIQIEHVCSKDSHCFNPGDKGVLTVSEDNGDWCCYMFGIVKTIISKETKFKIIE